MSKKVSLNNLGQAIAAELEAYAQDVQENISVGVSEITKEITEELKNDPIVPTLSGKYKKSFYFKKLAEGHNYVRFVVANKRYRLTHLLERGHAKTNGGRTRAFPHWKPAEDKLNKKMQELIERAAKGK